MRTWIESDEFWPYYIIGDADKELSKRNGVDPYNRVIDVPEETLARYEKARQEFEKAHEEMYTFIGTEFGA